MFWRSTDLPFVMSKLAPKDQLVRPTLAVASAGHDKVAYARTGNVPMLRTLTGTALNRNPVLGTASRFVRCSQIGIPAARSVE